MAKAHNVCTGDRIPGSMGGLRPSEG